MLLRIILTLAFVFNISTAFALHQDYTPIKPLERFVEMDKNNDEAITFEEFSAILKDIFERIDTNDDGKLSFDEMLKDHMERYGDD
jgi:Ca2+-binding EF-hand superfamily protein